MKAINFIKRLYWTFNLYFFRSWNTGFRNIKKAWEVSEIFIKDK